MLSQAIRDLLVADSTLTALLATYDFGGAEREPAVFTVDPAPKDAGQPLVVVTDLDPSDFGTRADRGSLLVAEVQVWGDKDRSHAGLRAVAQAAWDAVDRKTPTLTGWTLSTTNAGSPVFDTDVDGFPGFRMRVDAYGLRAET